jgi:hypothetical protein
MESPIQSEESLPEMTTECPDGQGSPMTDSSGSGSQSIIGGVKPGLRKYRRQLGDDGKPKKNFYNPPGKVMRHLAQQSYYDNFYGN